LHPLFANRRWIGVYVVACGLAGAILAELLRSVVPQPYRFAQGLAVPMCVFYGFGVLSAWWICRTHPLSRTSTARVVRVHLGAALQAAAVLGATSAIWGVAFARMLPDTVARSAIVADAFAMMVVGIPLFLLSSVLHYLALSFEASREAERRVLESELGAREAELRALRAQLNPHFLFNSLNSINALIGSDPEGARRMCEGLGDFLRRTLALGARDDVALGEELELVDRYLAIEQVRFGERLRVRRQCPPELLAARIPPLLLQPLVENAIKHGIATLVEGGAVTITARQGRDGLVITVENPVDSDAPRRSGANLGLENVRRRLHAFGASAARLHAESDGERFLVTLTLPAVVGAGEIHD
jgi:LytS/YehU family sensor histidine kinase